MRVADGDGQRVGGIRAETQVQRADSCLTMCATWVFSAPPTPTTASFTARGAYSCTPSDGRHRGQRGAPGLAQLERAVGILGEEHALHRDFLRDDARAMSSATRAWMMRRRSASGPPEVAMQP